MEQGQERRSRGRQRVRGPRLTLEMARNAETVADGKVDRDYPSWARGGRDKDDNVVDDELRMPAPDMSRGRQ
jgi:hypothetical protein